MLCLFADGCVRLGPGASVVLVRADRRSCVSGSAITACCQVAAPPRPTTATPAGSDAPEVLCPHTAPMSCSLEARVQPPFDTARFGMLIGVLGLVVMIGLAGWVLLITDNLMGAVIAILFVVALAVVVRVKR